MVWPVLQVDQRSTFVMDRAGAIRGRFQHEMNVNKHIESVQSLLATLPPS